jgi:predicted methyltransferase
VFDVGDHIGYYTLLSSEIVGSTGKVVAFEPDPKNSHYL